MFTLAGEPGGTRHHEIAQHLVRQGHRVTVIAGSASYLTGDALAAGKGVTNHVTPEGIRVLRVHGREGLGQGLVGRTARLAGFVPPAVQAGWTVDDVDIVVGTTPPIFQAPAAAALARRHGCPFVLEVRDLWPDFAVATGVLRNPLLIAAARRLERWLYRRADLVILNSPGFLSHVGARGAERARTKVVPNGVEVGHFSPESDGAAFRKAEGLEGKFVALYAGAHGVANQLEVLLNAAEELRKVPDFVLVLVGGGREKPRLMELASARGLTNVRFVAPRPKEAMAEVLAAADVCVANLQSLSQFATVYPNKVFDYMAAGRPIVLGIEGVIRDVVVRAEAGIPFPPGDGSALAKAILVYRADPELRRWHGTNGRTAVEKDFQRRDQAILFSRLLTQAVEAGPR